MIWFWIYLGGMASWCVIYPALSVASGEDPLPSLLWGGAPIWPVAYLIMLGVMNDHGQK